jgi:hypothetical protein
MDTPLTEFLKTRSGLFLTRWANMIIVIVIFYFTIKFSTPALYIALLSSIISLIYVEINFFTNFNLFFVKSYISHDRALWEEIKHILPPLGSLKYVKDTDFAGTFASDRLGDIAGFIYLIEYSIDKRFQDTNLEQLRFELFEAANIFIENIAGLTYPHGELQGVPREWRDSDDDLLIKKFNDDVKIINESARQLIAAYSVLTKYAIKHLYVD